jgi:hypothetical protein
MTYHAPPRLLTPGLTDRQTQRLSWHLSRLTASAPDTVPIYTDADRFAGRWIAMPERAGRTPALSAITEVAEGHPATAITLVAYITGLAQGIRLGRILAPAQKKRAKRWISEEYRRLSEAGRREVARYVRRLLALEIGNPKPRRMASAKEEARAARAWIQRAGAETRERAKGCAR